MKKVTAIHDRVAVTFLFKISNIINEPFGIFPAKAGVRNGLAVGMLGNLLVALDEITLDHDALDELVDVGIVLAGVHDFAHNANLLLELLVGVAMVRIHDAGGIQEVSLVIFF